MKGMLKYYGIAVILTAIAIAMLIAHSTIAVERERPGKEVIRDDAVVNTLRGYDVDNLYRTNLCVSEVIRVFNQLSGEVLNPW